jgi:ABC-type transport system involved in Fe-S cluster assembly fused permease/ATPase subunit
MEKKTLRELYFDVLAAIYETTEYAIELTEVELGKENDIQFCYRERDYYWLYVDENDIKITELCTHYPADSKDSDEELKAVRLFNHINKKFKMVKMFYDEEAKGIISNVDPETRKYFIELKKKLGL